MAVRPVGLSPPGLARDGAFFVREPVRAGFGCARRIIAPQLWSSPGFARYQIRLRQGGARLLFANSVSLMSGILAADLIVMGKVGRFGPWLFHG